MKDYAKVIVLGSPITKSNFKLHNKDGRAILPYNTGKSHDKYALYEEEIAYYARSQNPDVILEESLIAILKVYYKSEKRHPDTANITKSIFDGIEKSGLIVNDAQIRRIIVEEFYDKENPRFELELFGESSYSISYSINEKEVKDEQRLYSSLKKSTAKNKEIIKTNSNKTLTSTNNLSTQNKCSICNSLLKDNNFITADKGKTLICKSCFNKLF
ncbi:RusA family crossover junction endodeoxyribonuclease [Clostridium celatum]|uniref:Crossover junction endodeoxyribonuclease RusA n=1 Tax=Clostridium celatum DSM 1785 TaxID=545697 RepID=L1QHY1_9CLOT|nr:RusA family crossover junction endodeoxyribonuclease [Clostridium celatum]EKY27624.1 crossover junction endodeoxyribonuclease RusA [Clostridium celatum DSM 1785]MCE9655590.1 RusA family crossover junction endodeoxyribonuclease [Clostridium celatum]MDU3721906.1 RusA family crossover junction endodeoxyribonuclease [Clostridium celatum]MDY3359934.1 RusA family crossover junction endodeoxyribonuclease [Clostridium celatum]